MKKLNNGFKCNSYKSISKTVLLKLQKANQYKTAVNKSKILVCLMYTGIFAAI